MTIQQLRALATDIPINDAMTSMITDHMADETFRAWCAAQTPEEIARVRAELGAILESLRHEPGQSADGGRRLTYLGRPALFAEEVGHPAPCR
jgi:hypothetical protein